ncbi:MAG: GTP-binding protein [Tenuifilaceae bacterium]|jgi:Ni2+-binding GTPase involved in maturation of urease and hydrogenase|nr:GTP-binding protein [Tenuifilaceae bacterium]
MKLVIIAGTPGAGKTSILMHTIKSLQLGETNPAVVKVDCLSTDDDKRFSSLGIPVLVGLSRDMCPDHFSIYNLDEMVEFANKYHANTLIMETAGLCHRCAPYTDNCLGICVIDSTSGPNNPGKAGPFLSCADIVVITKGDMISQAEREIFRERILEANPTCKIIDFNGLNGQGAAELAKQILQSENTFSGNEKLRHNAPFSVCTLCVGEQRVSKKYHRGLLRNMTGCQEYVGE